MKKIMIKNIWLPVIAAAILTGCKDEKLNPIPQTSISDDFAFTTPDRIAQEVNGVYSACKNGQFLGGRTLVYNDVRGEDWLNVTGNGVTAVGVWNYSVTSTDNQVENMWIAAYNAINRANITIEGIAANPGVVTPALATRYTAEARFLRALSYYYLAGIYGRRPFNADAGASPGLPLRLTGRKNLVGGTAMARSTMAQTYQQIINDLIFAETNLPLTYGSADSNVVRAHRNAAIALKTRVYLQMGQYNDVITEANKIVPATAPFVAATGVQHRLNNVFLNVFRASYTTTESIFS
ncbi:MAG: RagB/SusD family nutrient uptake outer membrane protein, partial [Dinghuibacter sp.]|nr:RagB/SusD family nutrient uptake outer membrane protein [Dinghuibacter sp.]